MRCMVANSDATLGETVNELFNKTLHKSTIKHMLFSNACSRQQWLRAIFLWLATRVDYIQSSLVVQPSVDTREREFGESWLCSN